MRKWDEITDQWTDRTTWHSPRTRMTRTRVAFSIVSICEWSGADIVSVEHISDGHRHPCLVKYELDCLHLDVLPHGEAISVGAVTNALTCISQFLSADMISSFNWSTRCICYKNTVVSSPLQADVTPLGDIFLPLSCCADKVNCGSWALRNIHAGLHINNKCKILNC